jgi:DNA-binding MarR family transcriptional regulator
MGMRRAPRCSAMNQIIFRTKRAHHGFLRVTRKPLAYFGLTAARFDLLYALHNRLYDVECRCVPTLQSELRRDLGVTPPVVSRMLGSLEKLGLVTRSRPERRDRRQRYVSFTKVGLERIRAALKILLKGATRLVHEVISLGMHRDPGKCFEHMGMLESYLLYMGRSCGDRAGLWYPWHPDD